VSRGPGSASVVAKSATRPVVNPGRGTALTGAPSATTRTNPPRLVAATATTGPLDELRTRTARELRAVGSDDQAATLGKGLWARTHRTPGS